MSTNTTTGPMDVGSGSPPVPSCDQSEYPGVPGHNTPMHPGFNGKPDGFSPRTHSKHKSFQREPAPSYHGGFTNNDGSQ